MRINHDPVMTLTDFTATSSSTGHIYKFTGILSQILGISKRLQDHWFFYIQNAP